MHVTVSLITGAYSLSAGGALHRGIASGGAPVDTDCTQTNVKELVTLIRSPVTKYNCRG